MIIVWAFSFIVVDIAVDYIPPLSFALFRFLIASLCFLIIDLYFYLKRKRDKRIVEREENLGKSNSEELNNFERADTNSHFGVRLLPKLSTKQWLSLILASFSGISFFFLAQYTSIQLIGPSLPALFVCLLAPVLISLLALVFFNERLTKIKIIGFIIATIGGYFLVTGGDIGNLLPDSPNFVGYFLALLTPILWAIYSIITKKIIQKLPTLQMIKIVAYLGTFELFIFVLLDNQLWILLQNLFNILLITLGLYVGVICYIIGYFIWQHSQKQLQSSKVASFLYIEPFITLIASIFLQLEQTILLWNILGGIIVLLGVLLINYK
jgi:drug/metabolite transporter (DMT)-like permease